MALRRDWSRIALVPLMAVVGALASAGVASADLTPTERIVAPDPTAGSLLGTNFAEDGGTLFRSFGSDSTDAPGQGSVIVYEESAGFWVPVQRLVASDGSAGDRFGDFLVAGGGTLFASAYEADAARGAVYVFTRVGGVWTEQAKLVSPDGAADETFGAVLAHDGDTLIVGAPTHDGGHWPELLIPGAAFVFTSTGGSWTFEAELLPPDPHFNQLFGYDVAVSGDTALVGSALATIDGLRVTGAVFAFTRSNGVWTLDQRLTPSDPREFSHFGWPIVLDGDRAFIAARFAGVGSIANAGVVYEFVRTGGVWTQAARLTSANPLVGAFFGGSLAIEDDVMLVGESGSDTVHVLDRVGGTWTERTRLVVPGTPGSDAFGVRVAFADDDMVLASSRLDVDVPVDAGALYEFSLAGDTVGMFDPVMGIWLLRDGSGVVHSFYYGSPGDVPFMGDWDCDGTDTPGLYRQSDGYVYLRNSNTQGIADLSFYFGNPGDVPVAGDWNGDGCDTVSLYRPVEQRFYIVNTLGSADAGLGAADYSFGFGNPGDMPVTGDWDGDGIDGVGLYRESTGHFYYRDALSTGIADGEFYFGNPADRFVAGDWGVVDGADTPGVFRPSTETVYLRHSSSQGVADQSFLFGEAGFVPVAGRFGLG